MQDDATLAAWLTAVISSYTCIYCNNALRACLSTAQCSSCGIATLMLSVRPTERTTDRS